MDAQYHEKLVNLFLSVMTAINKMIAPSIGKYIYMLSKQHLLTSADRYCPDIWDQQRWWSGIRPKPGTILNKLPQFASESKRFDIYSKGFLLNHLIIGIGAISKRAQFTIERSLLLDQDLLRRGSWNFQDLLGVLGKAGQYFWQCSCDINI